MNWFTVSNEIAVVIPTYNEKQNIVKLIDEIDHLNLPIDILVVDDNSPDGTGDAVESLKKKKPNLDVIHRKRKEGIGPAYIEAFRYILQKSNYRYIIQMDADFSHNPKDIPRLLEVGKESEVVVGSRYVKGGGISNQWSILRKFISRLGNFYARVITGLNIRDSTAGFKCYRKKVLQSMDFDKIFLNGYGFQIQMLHELNKNNFRICEIPIFFEERVNGASKMNFHIVLEAFFSLMYMKIRDTFVKK